MFIYEIILILLSLAGLYVANKIRTEKKAGHKMVCPLDGNCEEVLNSDFAKIVGVPLELAGIGYFLTVISTNILFIIIPSLKFSILEIILFGVTLFGFLFSIYLTSIQAFYLKNWCTWCLYSALFSTLIFIVATGNFLYYIKEIVATMQSMPIFFVAVNVAAYAVGTALAIVIEVLTLRFLRDFRIDQNEKMTLMYLWQALWSVIFLVIISSFAIFVFELALFDDQKLFIIKSIIFGLIIIGSAIMSFYFIPKLDKSQIKCSVTHIRKTSFYRNAAIALSTMLLASWIVNVFINQIFGITDSFKSNFMQYIIIAVGSAALVLLAFQYRDKKVLNKILDNKK